MWWGYCQGGVLPHCAAHVISSGYCGGAVARGGALPQCAAHSPCSMLSSFYFIPSGYCGGAVAGGGALPQCTAHGHALCSLQL